MMTGFLIVFGIWMALYGLNVPIRAYLIRRHYAKHEVLQRIDVDQPLTETPAFSNLLVKFGIAAMVVTLVQAITQKNIMPDLDSEKVTLGMLLGLAATWIQWRFYLKSKTRCREVVLFDRDGVTMFTPRYMLVSQAAFQSRIEWKDCFGYSVFRGHVMFALRPIGHVEQLYGAHREEMERALNSLGIPKVNAYDVIQYEDSPEEHELLRAFERQMQAIASDVAASYCTELTSQGAAIEIELLNLIEGNPEDNPDEHRFLRFRLTEGEKTLHQLDWLIWALYDDQLELLSLPEHQYYEEIDGRVQSMVEMRMREVGVEQKPVVLQ